MLTQFNAKQVLNRSNHGKMVLEMIDVMGRDAVVAGGFIRDHMLGRQHKDVDVWCLGEVTPDMVIGKLEDGLPHMFKGIRVEDVTGDNEYEDREILLEQLLKVKLACGLSMDIIQRPEGLVCWTPRDVIEQFDLTVNALVVDPVFLEKSPCMYTKENEPVLPIDYKNITPERLHKMQGYLPRHNFRWAWEALQKEPVEPKGKDLWDEFRRMNMHDVARANDVVEVDGVGGFDARWVADAPDVPAPEPQNVREEIDRMHRRMQAERQHMQAREEARARVERRPRFFRNPFH